MFEFFVLTGAPTMVAFLVLGALSLPHLRHHRTVTLGALVVVCLDGALLSAIVSVGMPTPTSLVGWILLGARDAIWALIVARALLAVERMSNDLRAAGVERAVSKTSPQKGDVA